MDFSACEPAMPEILAYRADLGQSGFRKLYLPVTHLESEPGRAFRYIRYCTDRGNIVKRAKARVDASWIKARDRFDFEALRQRRRISGPINRFPLLAECVVCRPV
jgi:hypothetical protein